MEVASEIVRLTLGITRIIAQESLEVSVWGSEDGEHWEPLIAFPQKFYCGTYSMIADLTRHPDVRYLRAHWKVGRWMQDDRAPLSGGPLARDVVATIYGAYLSAAEGRRVDHLEGVQQLRRQGGRAPAGAPPAVVPVPGCRQRGAPAGLRYRPHSQPQNWARL